MTPEQRSYNMSKIRSKNTSPEIQAFDYFNSRGYEFLTHVKQLPGSPDIVFPIHKIAVFIDGSFWHGKTLKKAKSSLSDYWIQKITYNIERDRSNRSILQKNGWSVMSIWDDDLKKESDKHLKRIEKTLNKIIPIKQKVNLPAVFSFFSGIGLLDLGFEQAGFKLFFSNEINPNFIKANNYARNNMGFDPPVNDFHTGSIEEFLNGSKNRLSMLVERAKKKYGLVGFVGGPPCPDFSTGGKNLGKDGKYGVLSEIYIETIIEHSPDFFLFENVKGLWHTRKHREYYEKLKNKLHKHGYITTEKLINSLEYGVPQNRERLILIGFRRHLLEELGFSLSKTTIELHEDLFPWLKYALYRKQEVKELPWPSTEPFAIDSEKKCPSGIIADLTVQNWFKKNNTEKHPNAQHYFKPRSGLQKMTSTEEGYVIARSYKRLHRWRFSPTVAYGNNEVHLHPYKARRLTVSEALALQSAPENFVVPEDMTLTDMFKTVSNCVPFLVSYSIACSMADFIIQAKT